MSAENVDRTREAIDAMNRRDIDGVLRLFDPEVRFEHKLAALQGSFVGIDGVRGWFADLLEDVDSWRIDCPDIVIWATACLRSARSMPPGGRAASRPSCPHGSGEVPRRADDPFHRLR